ncbi:T9SS type B sorting domain-containing protein [Aestuariibaculum suncheonense]|uniref:T9SS type B sorting domain-containing protein n=1 Tax=Aestuariibaculum suncheonense TaxID=1028745 RepID=A0A8J6UC41_9FLAO|nr:T9SS type B sorting domain-containing protein [Aestuariibaculum suncheonense]MBD0836370.1 T9SS type B sorting domain-containing protein [Aestuariibaculum suncheonense]
MFKLRNAFLYLLLFSCFQIIAQNETNNWYFGENAGLNFANVEPIVLNDGAILAPAGCSSISDNDGNLLFYTNGQTVWNSNHDIMVNGTNLAGDINNSQSALIIPKPLDPSTYYIFTTRETPSSTPLVTSGLFYSTVRFTAQSPLGEITTKNSRLTSSTTQRLTAIHDISTNSIKVITFGSEYAQEEAPKDTFFVYDVTTAGLNTTPVKSKERIIKSSAGGMKISPDGKIIALADYGGNYIYLYNFNSATSEVKYYNTVNPNLLMNPLNPYSVEFSQDSRILYFTGNNSRNVSFLYKYLLYNTSIFNDKIYISSSAEQSFGDLQLAKDGKIYMANYVPTSPPSTVSSISVINTPEMEEGNSGFSPQIINLNGGASFKGMPIFVSSFLRNRIITENQCEGDPFSFTTDSYIPVDSILWDFGDNTTSNKINPTHTYTRSGNYTVKATILYNGEPFYVDKNIEVYEVPKLSDNAKLTQCDIDEDGISFFNLNHIRDAITNFHITFKLYFYHTYTDAENNTNLIEDPENYVNTNNPEKLFVKITTRNGCYTISDFFIETLYNTLPYIETMYACGDSDNIKNNNTGLFNLDIKKNEIRNSFNIPDSSIINFYSSLEDAQRKTQPLSAYIYKTGATKLYVRIEPPDNTCAGIGFFNVTVNSPIETHIDELYTICSNNEDIMFNLDGGKDNDQWEWKDANGNIFSTNQTINLNTPGIYSLTTYKTENNITCIKTEDFTIQRAIQIEINEIIANDYQIFVSVKGVGNYEFSIDEINYYGNGTEYKFNNVEAGIHNVHIRDIDNCKFSVLQKVSFIGFPKYFTPNNDGINDYWKIEGIDFDFYQSASIEIYNRYGKILYTMNIEQNLVGWDGTCNGQPLISSDYWFRGVLTDINNETLYKTGHFSLKR